LRHFGTGCKRTCRVSESGGSVAVTLLIDTRSESS
jgi:hypothetical protein